MLGGVWKVFPGYTEDGPIISMQVRNLTKYFLTQNLGMGAKTIAELQKGGILVSRMRNYLE